MEKKNILGFGILLVILLVVGAIVFNIYMDLNSDEEQDNQNTDTIPDQIEYDDINFEYEYVGNSLWRYTISGTLPNPCYKISTEAIVMESYPEQVIVKSTVLLPDAETVCVQIIQEVFEEGEFEASEQAQVRFEIE